jgi:hypothetical protein
MILPAAVFVPDWSAMLQYLWDLIPPLVGALLGALALVIIWVVRLVLQLLRLRLLRDCARQLVRWAAQKLPEDLSGSAKFRSVMDRLKKIFPRVPEDQLEHAIEEAVLELKHGLSQL